MIYKESWEGQLLWVGWRSKWHLGKGGPGPGGTDGGWGVPEAGWGEVRNRAEREVRGCWVLTCIQDSGASPYHGRAAAGGDIPGTPQGRSSTAPGPQCNSAFLSSLSLPAFLCPKMPSLTKTSRRGVASWREEAGPAACILAQSSLPTYFLRCLYHTFHIVSKEILNWIVKTKKYI